MAIDISREVIGAALVIHRKLGPGLLESAYEACLAYELEKSGFRVERQKAVPLVYETVKLDCGFRADMVADGKLVVELKCKEAIHPWTKLNCCPTFGSWIFRLGCSSTSTWLYLRMASSVWSITIGRSKRMFLPQRTLRIREGR